MGDTVVKRGMAIHRDPITDTANIAVGNSTLLLSGLLEKGHSLNNACPHSRRVCTGQTQLQKTLPRKTATMIRGMADRNAVR
jgi:hypothetical protein